MNIDTNSIGNYFPKRVNNSQQSQLNTSRLETKKADPKVTSEEKQFFAKLYPENKEEIVDYHFYNTKGKMNGVSVGSRFDRRG